MKRSTTTRTPIALENKECLVEVEPQHGRIIRIRDKSAGFELIGEPRLADNFTLLLPRPDLQANYLHGRTQKLSSSTSLPGCLTLEWKGPLAAANGEPLDLDVTMVITLDGSTLEFRINVANRSPHRLAEAWYPVLGGLLGIGGASDRADTRALLPLGFSQKLLDPFKQFGGKLELGTETPEIAWSYPGWMPMPWLDFFHVKRKRGFYFAAHDLVARNKAIRLSLEPGTGHLRPDSDWPRPGERGDHPAGLTINWACFPYTPPGETFESPPIVLRFHEGDWHAGAKIYREWFTRNFPIPNPGDSWLRRETAWQDTMFLLPEDNLNFTFRDIPRWARDARDAGVKTVLLSGWDRGGHDNLYPYYEPDPRLGTWNDLEAGIRACHDLGLRVLFFVNIHYADPTTDWFREELHRYVPTDPWGIPLGPQGFGMGTLSARLNDTRRPMVNINPAHPEVRALHVRQFRKLAEIGADGVHIDKVVGATCLDFNPRLTASPDRSSWEGVLICFEEILRACREVRPDFCVSAEANWDRLLAFTGVYWWAPPEPSAVKTAFPEWVPSVGITQPYDYNLVNRAVLHGEGLLIGPGHYTRSMGLATWRGLSRYIREIIRIRELLLDLLYLGEPLDPAPVTIKAAAAQLRHARWSVFRSLHDGRRACVLVNNGPHPIKVTFAGFHKSGRGRRVRLHHVFKAVRQAAVPARITVPPERLVIIEEV